MKHRLSFIFSVLVTCTLMGFQLKAQDVEVDTLVRENNQESVEDLLKVKTFYPLIRDVSAILDYGKIFGYLSGVEKKNEIGVQIGFKKNLLLIAEAGYSILNPNDSYVNADYQVRGKYMRLGVGINKAITAENNLTLSLRYAMSEFEDQGTINVTSSSGLFEPYDQSFSRKSLSASWYELVLGSEKKINTKLRLGFYLRVRVMNRYDEQEPYDVFTIPGYGRTFDNSVPAVNLYLRYILGGAKGPN